MALMGARKFLKLVISDYLTQTMQQLLETRNKLLAKYMQVIYVAIKT